MKVRVRIHGGGYIALPEPDWCEGHDLESVRNPQDITHFGKGIAIETVSVDVDPHTGEPARPTLLAASLAWTPHGGGGLAKPVIQIAGDTSADYYGLDLAAVDRLLIDLAQYIENLAAMRSQLAGTVTQVEQRGAE